MDPPLPQPQSPAGSPHPRAALAASVLRGLAHEVANAVQMLSLDSPSAASLSAARERLAGTAQVLSSLARDSEAGAGPAVPADVVAEVARWQSLQTEFAITAFTSEVTAGLPALACSHAHARAAILALVTDAKLAGATRVSLRVREEAGCVACELEQPETGPPSPGARMLAAEAGAALSAPAPGCRVLRLPALARPTGSA